MRSACSLSQPLPRNCFCSHISDCPPCWKGFGQALWVLKCKAQRCLKEECAEDHGSVSIPLWGFFLYRFNVVSLLCVGFCRAAGLLHSLWCFVPTISVFHTLYFFFFFFRDLIVVPYDTTQIFSEKKLYERVTGHTDFNFIFHVGPWFMQ